jgi:hypothetical protein
MRGFATRSAFAATLCTGVAMVGASVHGLVGVDAELQRSTLAAQHETFKQKKVGTFARYQHDGDCDAAPQSVRDLS